MTTEYVDMTASVGPQPVATYIEMVEPGVTTFYNLLKVVVTKVDINTEAAATPVVKARAAANDIAVPVNPCIDCQYLFGSCNNVSLSNS